MTLKYQDDEVTKKNEMSVSHEVGKKILNRAAELSVQGSTLAQKEVRYSVVDVTTVQELIEIGNEADIPTHCVKQALEEY